MTISAMPTLLHAERLHLGSQLVDAVAPLIQERDQVRARLAEQLHRERGFLGAIGHGFETLGQIEQHLIGRAQRAVLVLDSDADRREATGRIFRSGRRFQHGGGQLAQALLEGLARNTRLLGRGLPHRQSLNADTHPLGHLVERIAGVDGRFNHRGETGHRHGNAQTT